MARKDPPTLRRRANNQYNNSITFKILLTFPSSCFLHPDSYQPHPSSYFANAFPFCPTQLDQPVLREVLVAMPPSSPSEQARTRRDNDGTHSTYSLRSAPRSTRRVANRRALTTPRQESEASGHGHPSTAIPPTLPKPKSTRATRTASSISLKNGNESAPKQKAGQLQMLEDHENNNATTDARDTETEDADTSLASREHGKITPQQVQDKIAVFSKFVGSGNGSRTKSDPSLSSEQMLQNLNNHCEPNKNGGSLQEKLYSGSDDMFF